MVCVRLERNITYNIDLYVVANFYNFKEREKMGNIIKTLMVTGSNEDPKIKDDWAAAYDLDLNKEYQLHELVEITGHHPHNRALWVYQGPEWENKLTGEQYFNPWDGDNVKLVRPACIIEEKDDFMDEWRKEIANEAGMMGGLQAYNDHMYDYDIDF